MRTSLFVTCLVDQFWPEVGTATVEVLRRAGCEVVFDEHQTCCSQPAFNAGYRDEARRVATHFLELYGAEDVDAVVLPSGSCSAMVHHISTLFEAGHPLLCVADAVAGKTHELSAFLVRELGVTDLGAEFEGRIAWHDGCHGLRDLAIESEPRRLLAEVRGAELVELEGEAACCGFGGTFSVKYPELSVAILDKKLAALERAGVDAVVSGDASCLMQIGGRLSRTASSIKVLHLAELLASGTGARRTESRV